MTIQPLPFFFEDHDICPGGRGASASYNPLPALLSSHGFINYHISYEKGLLHTFYKYYSLVGSNPLNYSILNVFIQGLLLLFLFYWFRKTNNLYFGFLALIYFSWSIPMWAIAAGRASAPGITTIFFTVTALYVYYFHYQKEDYTLKWYILQGMIILLFTRMAILMKGEGRLIFFIIFFYLCSKSIFLFFKQKTLPLLKKRNIILLILLFLLCVPLYPFIAGVSGTKHVYKTDIIYEYFPGLFSLKPSALGQGFIHTDYSFYYHFLWEMLVTLFPYNLLAVFLLFLGLVLLCWQWRREKKFLPDENIYLYDLWLFSGVWFFITHIALISQRGFVYGGFQNFLLVDFYQTIFSFAVFLFTFFAVVYNKVIILWNKRRWSIIFSFFMFFILFSQIIILLIWSSFNIDFVVGLNDAATSLQETYPQAYTLLIVQPPIIHSNSPPVQEQFYSLLEFCSFIENKVPVLENQNFILISNAPVETDCATFLETMLIYPESDTVYYKIKNSLHWTTPMYVYV